MADCDFKTLIQRDRQERQQSHFSGTLLDYLAIVRENPRAAMLAHQRMHELLVSAGMELIRTDEHPRLKRIYGNDSIKCYRFFLVNQLMP